MRIEQSRNCRAEFRCHSAAAPVWRSKIPLPTELVTSYQVFAIQYFWTPERRFSGVAMRLSRLLREKLRRQPKRFERGNPLGTRRPEAPRAPSHGERLVSVRMRFSP